MAKSAVTEPKLIQATIALLWSNTCFASYWVHLSHASRSYLHLFVPPSYIDICAWWTTLSPLYMHIFRCSHCIRRLGLCHRLVIGLFGLIGMFGIAVGPFVGRVVSHLVSWYAMLLPPCHHRDHSSSPTIIVVCNVGGLCPLFRRVRLHCCPSGNTCVFPTSIYMYTSASMLYNCSSYYPNGCLNRLNH
jgi:hypothetical protein